MKIETAQKRIFNKINKDYPLLRTALRGYFIKTIINDYVLFQNDRGYDDMTDSEKLIYSYNINTCDWYDFLIDEFNDNLTANQQLDCFDYYYACRSL